MSGSIRSTSSGVLPVGATHILMAVTALVVFITDIVTVENSDLGASLYTWVISVVVTTVLLSKPVGSLR
jgi:hypothetical protein